MATGAQDLWLGEHRANPSGQTPPPASAAGEPASRLSFGIGERLVLLLAAGIAPALLAFVSLRFLYALAGWDIFLLLIFVVDLRSIPHPKALEMERSFAAPLRQTQPATVRLRLLTPPPFTLGGLLQDDLPLALSPELPELRCQLTRLAPEIEYTFRPANRGDYRLGAIYLRYQSPLRLASRVARFPITHGVRVYPALPQALQHRLALLRSRIFQRQLRITRQRGQGREFESLRDFQTGDELRTICWTATARRGKAVATIRQVERSQTVWCLIDCGRLMQARTGERTKLDYAVESALVLGQATEAAGDQLGLLAFGAGVQRRLLPRAGANHQIALQEQLACIRQEPGEADAMQAAAQLLSLQKSRAVIVWLTDLVDVAIMPDTCRAAIRAARRHVVLLAVMGQPDLGSVVAAPPCDSESFFRYAAATDALHRRQLLMAQMRDRGVNVFEVDAPGMAATVLNQYLATKRRELL